MPAQIRSRCQRLFGRTAASRKPHLVRASFGQLAARRYRRRHYDYCAGFVVLTVAVHTSISFLVGFHLNRRSYSSYVHIRVWISIY